MGAELTKQEQAALDALKKVCAKHGPKLPGDVRDCVFLKQQQEQDNRLKQATLDAIARQNLANEKVRALAFVTGKINTLQTQGILLTGALLQASGNYDQILAARAVKPVLFDILLTLTLTVIPDLKVVGRVAKAFLPRTARTARIWEQATKAVQESKGNSWEDTVAVFAQTTQRSDAKHNNIVAKLTTFGESLDNHSKDIIEAIKDPLAANADVDEETQKRFQAHQARNQILSQIINEIQRTLVVAGFVETICHQFIFWYEGPDLLGLVQKNFQSSGLDGDVVYKPSGYALYADLVLYDMLRAYVKSNFSVKGDGRSLEELPDYWPEENVSGLDEAQRKLIYAQFGKVRWNDSSRPAVNNYKQLLRHWQGQFVRGEYPAEPMLPAG